MLTIPGRKGCLCDGPTRRELLRVGSVGLFGLNLANFFQCSRKPRPLRVWRVR